MNRADMSEEEKDAVVRNLNDLMYGVPARLQRVGWDKSTELMLRDLESAKTCIDNTIALVKTIEENHK